MPRRLSSLKTTTVTVEQLQSTHSRTSHIYIENIYTYTSSFAICKPHPATPCFQNQRLLGSCCLWFLFRIYIFPTHFTPESRPCYKLDLARGVTMSELGLHHSKSFWVSRRKFNKNHVNYEAYSPGIKIIMLHFMRSYAFFVAHLSVSCSPGLKT